MEFANPAALQTPPITLPLFNPIDTSGSGLSLSAAVAAQSKASSQPQSVPAPHPQAASLSQLGPYSPGASLPPKLVKWILNLEFIEIAEIIMDDPLLLGTGHSAPPRLPVTDISQWVERYSAMAAIIATRFPHKHRSCSHIRNSLSEQNATVKQIVGSRMIGNFVGKL